MTHSRDLHHIVYHYADGVADILGLSTAQQLSIRTAMHLALREQAAGYEATAADAATRIQLLAYELDLALQRIEQASPEQFPAELANVKASPAPATISANGTHHTDPDVVLKTLVPSAVPFQIDAEAAQEAAATEEQPEPAPAPTKPGDRKPFSFTWGTLDDTSLAIARNLDAGKAAWRVVNPDDKRVIVLAAVKELQLDLPPGQTLSIEQFNNLRPIWMAGFPTLSISLGMTWKQMLAAAERV